MKLRPTTKEGKEYFERRRRKREKSRLFQKRKSRKRRIQKHKSSQYTNKESKTELGEFKVNLGNRLDPMEAGNETIKACKRIKLLRKEGGNVIFVDLDNVENFTLAGAVYLAACIDEQVSPRSKYSVVRGNFPKNENVANDFLASGFFNWFEGEGDDLPSATASWTRAQQNLVVTKTAAELVEFAHDKICISYPQRKAIWQNLVECMTNTHNHAKGRIFGKNNKTSTPPKKWMAGVMCKDREASFVFFDQGVGICASAGAQGKLKEIRKTLIGYGPENIVKEAFEGKLGSATKKRWRGLGLPRMRLDAENNLLPNLRIRTGRVEGNINKMRFRKTSENLQGTIFTWTAVSEENLEQ